jgi:UDP-N-acetylmuramoylalanine--D-glutamate ligase
MPDTGHEMKDDLEKHAKNSKILIANTMKEAVKLAYKNTESGKSVLLSPAATSFNMFTDYKERGEVFKKFVLELA